MEPININNNIAPTKNLTYLATLIACALPTLPFEPVKHKKHYFATDSWSKHSPNLLPAQNTVLPQGIPEKFFKILRNDTEFSRIFRCSITFFGLKIMRYVIFFRWWFPILQPPKNSPQNLF